MVVKKTARFGQLMEHLSDKSVPRRETRARRVMPMGYGGSLDEIAAPLKPI